MPFGVSVATWMCVFLFAILATLAATPATAPPGSANSSPTPVTLYSPTGVNITSISVNLSWTQNLDIDFQEYQMYFSTQASSLGELWETYNNRTALGVFIFGLQPGTTYYFVVRTMAISGLYADSNQVTVTTPILNEQYGEPLVGLRAWALFAAMTLGLVAASAEASVVARTKLRNWRRR